VSQSGSSSLNAKLTDFGYSRWLAPQEATSLIYLPNSGFWTAPEHHHRGFDFVAATKSDVYSFGVYALWLLFYNTTGSDNDFTSDTSDLEQKPMIELARSHVRGMVGAPNEQKAVLGQILELCLASEPEHRSPMGDILLLFQSALYV
jgi:serine/threonine protein kinase